MLKRSLPALLSFATLAASFSFWLSGQAVRPSDGPRFTTGNRLLRPANYREWIWLSSGLGMSYRPHAGETADENPPFDNVFVTPAAYHSFVETGKWPDKTIFVLESRASASKGSINQNGHFQAGFMGMEAEVKDESRFAGKWAFFDFAESAQSATAIATSAACYSCHAKNGAVDNTFVQFYPTLLEIAKRKGTVKRIPSE